MGNLEKKLGILHDKSKEVYPATRGIDLVFWQ